MLNTFSHSDGLYRSRIDGTKFPYADGEHALAWAALEAHNAKLIAADPAIAERPEYSLSSSLLLGTETGIIWFRDVWPYRYLREGVVIVSDVAQDFDDPLGAFSGCEIVGIATYDAGDNRLQRHVDKSFCRRCWFLVHSDDARLSHEISDDETYVDGQSWPPKGNGYAGSFVVVQPGETIPRAKQNSVLGFSEREVTADMRAEGIKHKRLALRALEERENTNDVIRYLRKLSDAKKTRELAAAKLAARNPFKSPPTPTP